MQSARAKLAVTACALLLAALAVAADEAGQLQVTTEQGVLKGLRLSDQMSVFRGIPYAAPPVGALRWRPPAAPVAWSGVRDASEFGPACIQPKSRPSELYADDPPRMGEDCLYLNVWKPAHASGAPVMLWIHGGALTTGHTGSVLYDGAQLASRGVIVVSINYRLGILGFLAHPALSGESPNKVSGNYGLLDQVAALRWVRANIKAFGGDADNVTIFGESAGALSVMDLLASPQTHGLFHKAIAESAYMVTNPELRKARHGLPSAEAIGELTGKAFGADSAASLRALDANLLVNKAAGGGYIPLPTVDGWFLPDQLVDIFDHGQQAHVPLLTGFNAGELRSLRGLLPPVPASAQAYEQQVKDRYGDLSAAYLKLYPSDDVEGSVLAASRDGLYGWTSQRLVIKQAAIGQPSFLYFFSHSYPSEISLSLQAFHASELPYVFGQAGSELMLPTNWPKPPANSQERELAAAMMDYWTSFARTGVPRHAGSADWRSFADDESYMEFQDRPLAMTHFQPGMYTLHEEVVARRRAAGNQYWFINIGLASPPVPPPLKQSK